MELSTFVRKVYKILLFFEKFLATILIANEVIMLIIKKSNIKFKLIFRPYIYE